MTRTSLVALALLFVGAMTWVGIESAVQESAAQPGSLPFTRFRLFNDSKTRPVQKCDTWVKPAKPANPDQPASWGPPTHTIGTVQTQKVEPWNTNQADMMAVAVRVDLGGGTQIFGWAECPANNTVGEAIVVVYEVIPPPGNQEATLCIGFGPAGATNEAAWITADVD